MVYFEQWDGLLRKPLDTMHLVKLTGRDVDDTRQKTLFRISLMQHYMYKGVALLF